MSRILHRLASLIGRRRFERELRDEVAFHLRRRTEHWQALGLDANEARRRARLEFGNVERVKQEVRDTRFGLWLEQTRQDLRRAVRAIAARPGTAALVVLILGLGIAAATTAFSVIDAVMLRELPHPRASELVMVTIREPERAFPRYGLSAAEFTAWQEEAELLQGLAPAPGGVSRYTMSGKSVETVSVRRQWVGLGLFELLGVAPALGRGFQSDDVHGGESETALISHGFWKQYFGGREDVVGETVDLLGRERTIIGVMPSGFRVAPSLPDVDVWMVRDYQGSSLRTQVMARLADGVSAEQAAAELQGIFEGLQGTEDVSAGTVQLVPLQEYSKAGYGRPLTLLSVAVALVLLVACLNVAGILLVHGMARAREVATRFALGASRGRVIRELLAESTLLALLAGLAGAALSVLGLRLFVAIADGWYPASERLQVNATVLGFAIALAVITGLATGLYPALRASTTDPMAAIARRPAGARSGKRRSGSVLVVLETALALVLLIGAGLMLNSVRHVLDMDMGFDRSNLAWGAMRVQGARYQETDRPVLRMSPEVSRLYASVIDHLSRQPGVEHVAIMTNGPVGEYMANVAVRVVGMPDPENPRTLSAQYEEISADAFDALGVSMLLGRAFTAEDDESAAPVAIVNQEFVRRRLAGENPIGQLVHADFVRGIEHADLIGDAPREIVGVVEDYRTWFQQPPFPTVYVPFRQHLQVYPDSGPWGAHVHKSFLVRGSLPPNELVRQLRDAVRAADDTQLLSEAAPFEERFGTSAERQRFWLRLLGLCAMAATLLAAVGIFGIVSQVVQLRRYEFGVRLAVGAQRRAILMMVLRQGAMLAGIGLALGVALAVATTRFLQRELYGVEATDPATFAGVAVVLALVSLLACAVPAIRAARVDPQHILRHE